MNATTTPDTLNAMVEFEVPFRVLPGAVIDSDLPGVYAPEVTLEVNSDGDPLPESEDVMIQDLARHGWNVLDGYSGQDRYSGPIMHASETLSGGLARDILEAPGTYVVCAVDTDDDDDTPAGWIILRRIPTGTLTSLTPYAAQDEVRLYDSENGDVLTLTPTEARDLAQDLTDAAQAAELA